LVLEGWSNRLDPHHSVLAQVQGMFEPQNLGWRERLGATVDAVMERGDGGLALDA
jgi:aarF domain-containing kinase